MVQEGERGKPGSHETEEVGGTSIIKSLQGAGRQGELLEGNGGFLVDSYWSTVQAVLGTHGGVGIAAATRTSGRVEGQMVDSEAKARGMGDFMQHAFSGWLAAQVVKRCRGRPARIILRRATLGWSRPLRA